MGNHTGAGAYDERTGDKIIMNLAQFATVFHMRSKHGGKEIQG